MAKSPLETFNVIEINPKMSPIINALLNKLEA
jgi:hypothetical protein